MSRPSEENAVTATVTDAGPFEKLVTFTVEHHELEAAAARTARRLSQEIRIKGFRPGKAPRPIVEATVGKERLRSETIDDLLPSKVAEVLVDEGLNPAVSPRLERLDDVIGGGVEVEVRVTMWPTLDGLPEYAGRLIEVGSPDVGDEELATQLDRIREQFAALEPADRPAADGDYVTIDLSVSHAGEPVPEASATDLLYEVGSSGFLEGIDDVLVGVSAGDTVGFDGTLPPGFGDKAGLGVVFSVAVKDVKAKVLPDLTDEWVSEITEFETVSDLEADLRGRIGDIKRRSLASEFRERTLGMLVDEIQLDLPDAIVRAEMDELLHRFAHRLEGDNVSLDDYFRVTGVSEDQFVADLRAQAERSIRTRLVLEAVADQEGVEVPDDELQAVVEVVALQSEQPDQVREAFAGTPRGQSLRGDILRSKALDALVALASPVDEHGNPVDLTVSEPEPPVEVEAEVVEGEIVEAIVEGEIIEAGEGRVGDGFEEE
jgi:trigger factor